MWVVKFIGSNLNILNVGISKSLPLNSDSGGVFKLIVSFTNFLHRLYVSSCINYVRYIRTCIKRRIAYWVTDLSGIKKSHVYLSRKLVHATWVVFPKMKIIEIIVPKICTFIVSQVCQNQRFKRSPNRDILGNAAGSFFFLIFLLINKRI